MEDRARQRVLAVTSQLPWPLNSGGHLRTFHLLKSIAAEADVRLVVPVRHGETAAPLIENAIGVIEVPAGPRRAVSEVLRLLTCWRRDEPYVMYGRHYSSAVAKAFRDELRRFEPHVVYLDHLDSFLYWSGPDVPDTCPALIDLHNVYSLLAKRSAEDRGFQGRRWFLQREARRLEAIERRAATRCDAVAAVSDAEADYYRALGARAVFTIPNGVDCEWLADLPEGRSGAPVVAFIGTMSWGPNAAAARFLAFEAFPALRQQVPDAKLVIIGRNPPPDITALSSAPGIEVTGTVPDMKPYLDQASILAVPLEAGGGTRLKILEAFAAGLPVVSTTIGCEGIAAMPDVHFVRAERREFAGAVAGLLLDRARGNQLARAARSLAREKYDWKIVGTAAANAVGRLGG